MGLLDDAIREHLELKRRHGADPEEVSRQEREALGAPVRGEFAQPAGAPEGEAPESEVDEELGAAEVAAVQAGPEDELPPREAEEASAAPAAGAEEDPWLVEDLADEEPRAEPEPEPDREPEQEPPPAEDVLEETPEFLQETPEHERLWFEQKPPRDFDWDK